MESHRQSRKLRRSVLRRTLHSGQGDTGREIVFCLVFLGMALYAAVLFGSPHYSYWAMKGRVAEIVRQSPYTDAQIRAKVMDEVAQMGLSLAPENIQIERTPKRNLLISMAWTEDVYFLDYYLTSYDFSIRAGGDPEY